MKTHQINPQNNTNNDHITDSGYKKFISENFTSLRHILNPDIPLYQKHDIKCHNSNIGVYPEVKNDRELLPVSSFDLGLYEVPTDHPTFDPKRHTFALGVCAPVKYDDPIWESVGKKKSKGSAEEIEEKGDVGSFGG